MQKELALNQNNFYMRGTCIYQSFFMENFMLYFLGMLEI